MKRLTLLFTVLFCVSLLYSNPSVTPKSSIKLFRSEHPIALSTPVLSKHNTLFIPLRDIAENYDYPLTFSRKNNHFIIKTPNEKVYLTANLKTYQKGTIKYSFSHKPFIYKSRLYIPLNGLTALNIKTEQKGSSFFLIQSQKMSRSSIVSQATSSSKATKKTTTLSSILFQTTHRKNDINASIHRKFSTIFILNHSYKRSDILSYYNKKPYINFKPIFLDNGYSIKDTRGGFIISKDNADYIFNQTQQSVTKKTGQESLKIPIKYQFIKHNNKLLFSEQSFLKDLGLIPYNNFKRKTAILLTKIKSLAVIKKNGSYELSIDAHHPVSIAGPFVLKNPLRLYWDIPYSHFDAQVNTQRLTDSGIQSISIGKHPSKTRVVLTLGQSMTSTLAQIGSNATITLKPGKLPSIAKKKSSYKPAVSRYKSSNLNSLRGRVIAIDPGHGGIDPGAIGIYNEKEKVYTLDISLRLKRELEKRGARVIIARSGDKNPSLGTRTRLANSYKADAFISVHVNSFVKSYAKGTETYYYKAIDKPLSREIQKGMVQTLKLQNNGIKKSNMYVLKYSTMPSVLIEPCFITNPTENYLIKQGSFRQKIADGVVIGLERYFKRYKKS